MGTERKSEFVFIPTLYTSNVFIPPIHMASWLSCSKKCVLCRPIYEVRVLVSSICRPIYEVRVFVSSIVFAAAIVG